MEKTPKEMSSKIKEEKFRSKKVDESQYNSKTHLNLEQGLERESVEGNPFSNKDFGATKKSKGNTYPIREEERKVELTVSRSI
jgi:hypothetical protein